MTDKELLELASNAAGIHKCNCCINCPGFQIDGETKAECFDWNPLTDDGDALRLAVATGVLQGNR
jgi:hypothetical protein